MSYFENGYALLVGVGDEDIPQSANDASKIYEVLTNQTLAAYNPDNVILLTKENATKNNVLNSLEEIANKSNEHSTIIIYYSGHGGEYRMNFEENEDIVKEYFLCTYGFDAKSRHQTGVDSYEFSHILKKVKSRKVLVLLDCCYAAGMIRKKSDTGFIKYSNLGIGENLAKGEGRAVMVSSDKNEYSYILKNERYSLFTKTILEALSGKAAKKGEEFVSVIQLMSYVLTEVPKIEKTQNPKIMLADNLNAKFLICRKNSNVEGSIFENAESIINNNVLKLSTNKNELKKKVKDITQLLNEQENATMAIELLYGLKDSIEIKSITNEIKNLSSSYHMNERNLRKGKILRELYVSNQQLKIEDMNNILQKIEYLILD